MQAERYGIQITQKARGEIGSYTFSVLDQSNRYASLALFMCYSEHRQGPAP